MEEEQVNFTVSIQFGVLSNDYQSLAASGGFYEEDAETGGEEDGEEPPRCW